MDGTAPGKPAPATFGADFLDWLKEATESRWRTYVPQDFVGGTVSGLDWQTGTKWRGGMSEAEISAAESRFAISFPPDYRLFLETLHTPDPELIGAAYEGRELVQTTGRRLPDWTGDPAVIEGLLDWAIEALLESSYRKAQYRWTSREDWYAARRRLLAAGPQYIPVVGRSYLLSFGQTRASPVISFDGTDLVTRAWGLRECLLEEVFAPLVPIPPTP